jgi:putative pyrroloquinoline-quinone binding quinoprotein/putative pyrroloquinoline-quinone-binding quinoprotein
VLVAALAGLTAWRLELWPFANAQGPPSADPPPSPPVSATVPPSPSPSAAPSPTAEPSPQPANTSFEGITTFRGNQTRTYYGRGPVPRHPVIRWRYPAQGALCSLSTDQHGEREWCGTGWTGQPNVIVGEHGRIEVRINAYDGAYHFLNGRTGEVLRPKLQTGDLAKGSATSDPDGYPLYYAGSRDNRLRVIALDRPEPTVLWELDSETSVPDPLWNDDWDGAPLQIGDYLLEGGENSWFYVIRLNRSYDADHRVTVNPKIVMMVPGYDQQLLNDLGDKNVSIENSVAFDAQRGVVYFANSGGLVQGWDISDVLSGGTHYERVFRFWDGDETDASIVIGPDGDLYVARHASANVPTRPQARDHQVGSLMKLDPTKPDNPVVWSVQLGGFEPDGGILGTPAYDQGIIYTTFTEGGFAAVGARSGRVLWTVNLPGPTWMSPVPIDGQLLVGDCDGGLHDYELAKKAAKPPTLLWTVQLEGCVESTPAVWHGMIFVGARGGAIYGIGD